MAGHPRVLIIGAGTAGMPCAITIAEAGGVPIVLEKADEVGGALHLSAGQMSAAGTRRQRSMGIEDSPDEHYADAIRIGRERNDPAIVRLAVDEAPNTINWLESLGFPFLEEMPVVYYGHEPYSKPRTYWGADLGRSILETVQPRFLELVDEGSIDLRLGHRMRELLVEDGVVVGVLVEGPDGPSEIRADVVVLATGGYTANEDLFRSLHPEVHCVVGGRHTSTGDGLVAARAIGAAARNFDLYLPSAGGIEWPPGSGKLDFWEAWANTMGYYRKAREIHVNAAGQRFIDEDIISPDARERALVQQGGRIWFVFDDASIDDADPLINDWTGDRLRAEAAAGNGMWVADDLPSLARKAGIDPDGLVKTAAEVAAIARGEMPDPFGREVPARPLESPPYYAVASVAATMLSFGGLHIDPDLRVLGSSGEPIPGLFAVGEVIGAGTTMGNSYCGGMCVTPSMSLGRLLGRRLVAGGVAATA